MPRQRAASSASALRSIDTRHTARLDGSSGRQRHAVGVPSARRVFIARARLADAAFVSALAPALWQFGWALHDEVPNRLDWFCLARTEIERCDAFVFVVSDAGLASAACINELRYAAQRKPVLRLDRQNGMQVNAVPELVGVPVVEAMGRTMGELAESTATYLSRLCP